MTKNLKSVAVVGSGPAGLMAASRLKQLGFDVCVFEGRSAPGYKLLVAGRSGLNVSHASLSEAQSIGALHNENFCKQHRAFFTRDDWLNFIHQLGIKTFVGTSHRDFIESLKAGPLLKAWVNSLKADGVKFFYNHNLVDFESNQQKVILSFSADRRQTFDAAVFALGGASWLGKRRPSSWWDLFQKKEITLAAFHAANCGFEVDWKKDFLAEAEGLPFKNLVVKTKDSSFAGELVVTNYGLEGTPLYHLRNPQTVWLDLFPHESEQDLVTKLQKPKENLNPIRRVNKALKLSAAVRALLFHEQTVWAHGDDVLVWAQCFKNFPLHLKKQRSLDEAISSSGGVLFSEVTENLELKKFPRLFVAGEMLDWDAPTGGYLIQNSVSQGACVAQKISDLFKI